MISLSRSGFYLLLALSITACASVAPSSTTPPEVVNATIPELVDPQVGFSGTTADPKTASRYARAVESLNAGRIADAEKRLIDLLERDPGYAPATMLLARLAIERGEYDRAAGLIDRAAEVAPGYLAADIYEAELAIARGDRAGALSIYRRLAAAGALPEASATRLAELQRERFDALVARSAGEAADQRIATLREALAIQESEPVRVSLVRVLVEEKMFDTARRELEPLLLTSADSVDVQELLAEIDVAAGRYQEAIARLERLSKRGNAERYLTRLNQVKRLWTEANMPPQYRRAIDSNAINRADFAVLLYWKVSAVRFARPSGQPPIAVDIGDVPGRDELVRALALRMFPVDPVTRSVDPYRTLTATTFSRLVNRVMSLRGSLPACASTVTESNEALRGQKMLELCSIDSAPLRAAPDAPVSGEYASNVLTRIDALLSK